MKAIAVFEALPANSPNCFEMIELETPVSSGRDIFVRIDAIAINPVDSKERLGITGRLDEPLILGWDTCGEVISVGEDVQNFKPGDMVISAGDITRQGCYAEYQLLDERIVGRKNPLGFPMKKPQLCRSPLLLPGNHCLTVWKFPAMTRIARLF